MKLTIDITREDYADFNKFHLFSKKLKRMVIVGFLTIIIVQLMLNTEGFDWIVTLISSVICFLIYFFSLKISLNRTKNIPEKEGTILGEKQLEFAEEKIFYKASDSEGSINWTAIKRLEEGKNAFYLYMDANMAMIVPKRFLNDVNQETEFRDMVGEKIHRN